MLDLNEYKCSNMNTANKTTNRAETTYTIDMLSITIKSLFEYNITKQSLSRFTPNNTIIDTSIDVPVVDEDTYMDTVMPYTVKNIIDKYACDLYTELYKIIINNNITHDINQNIAAEAAINTYMLYHIVTPLLCNIIDDISVNMTDDDMISLHKEINKKNDIIRKIWNDDNIKNMGVIIDEYKESRVLSEVRLADMLRHYIDRIDDKTCIINIFSAIDYIYSTLYPFYYNLVDDIDDIDDDVAYVIRNIYDQINKNMYININVDGDPYWNQVQEILNDSQLMDKIKLFAITIINMTGKKIFIYEYNKLYIDDAFSTNINDIIKKIGDDIINVTIYEYVKELIDMVYQIEKTTSLTDTYINTDTSEIYVYIQPDTDMDIDSNADMDIQIDNINIDLMDIIYQFFEKIFKINMYNYKGYDVKLLYYRIIYEMLYSGDDDQFIELLRKKYHEDDCQSIKIMNDIIHNDDDTYIETLNNLYHIYN